MTHRTSTLVLPLVMALIVVQVFAGCSTYQRRDDSPRSQSERILRESAEAPRPSSPKLHRGDALGGVAGYIEADDSGTLLPDFSRVGVVNDQAYPDMYFKHFGTNPTIDTEEENFSTFSVDVDRASYTLTRSYLERGTLVPEEAVRVEEFVNAFDYDYALPKQDAFAFAAEAAPSPNRPGYHLLHLGIKGQEVHANDRKPANLIFIIDVSGSMGQENRLGLVKRSLQYLVEELDDRDSVGIVIYGDRARTILEPTWATEKRTILRGIDALQPGGSTNAQAGIELGYTLANRAFIRGGINRIILCSDGVANNGIATGAEGIFQTVENKAKRGITISTIGFGMGNYNDILMEKLAQMGDGNYYYVDREKEAKRVFVENLTSTLQVIAKDVKIQVEFDEKVISRYRLLGYENRILEKDEFQDDKVDAGEIGAGHSVTAIYEVKFRGRVKDFGWMRVRYKEPMENSSRLIERELSSSVVKKSYDDLSSPTRLSFTVAAFAEKLRGSYWSRGSSYSELQDQFDALPSRLQGRENVRELGDLIHRAARLDTREDRFERDLPYAQMDFDRVPVLE